MIAETISKVIFFCSYMDDYRWPFKIEDPQSVVITDLVQHLKTFYLCKRLKRLYPGKDAIHKAF